MDGHSNEALCANCRRAGGCTIPGDLNDVILSCDSFESLDDMMPGRIKHSPQPDPSRMDGLCVDCGNRLTCVFRQPEGGTWHCEEYC